MPDKYEPCVFDLSDPQGACLDPAKDCEGCSRHEWVEELLAKMF